MTDDQPKYDIAISFLVADEKIASSLNAGLGDLKVFFYPHKQEELIGTNGMESMRAPFIGARVNVILFREKYGKTPWTGVELAAIQDSCLRTGYRSLVFVQLDKKDVKPEWLPSTHIRCLLDDFTIEQLIGAIKSKVQENGGTIRRPNARTEALRVQEEASYLADRDRLMRDSTWIGELRRCVDDTIIEIGRIVSELNTKNKLNIGFGKGQGGVTILRSGFSACRSAGSKRSLITSGILHRTNAICGRRNILERCLCKERMLGMSNRQKG
jgi:hypothetical protein